MFSFAKQVPEYTHSVRNETARVLSNLNYTESYHADSFRNSWVTRTSPAALSVALPSATLILCCTHTLSFAHNPLAVMPLLRECFITRVLCCEDNIHLFTTVVGIIQAHNVRCRMSICPAARIGCQHVLCLYQLMPQPGSCITLELQDIC